MAQRSKPREPKKSWEDVKAEYEKAKAAYDSAKGKSDSSEETLRGLAKVKDLIEPLYNALQQVGLAQEEFKIAAENEKVAQAGSDESAKKTTATALLQAKDKLAMVKEKAA